MLTITNENIVMFDVDDTLVMWTIPPEHAHETIVFESFGIKTVLLPHLKHIELLKQFKARGHMVIVWSQGGSAWAQAVVETLGLIEYVDQVMCKPKWIVDDLPPSAWMSRSYMDIDGKSITKQDFKEDIK